MSDQQAPAQQDTPAVAGPDQAPGTAQEQAEVDWQKRYNDLQPEYTRTTQSLREAEQKQQWYDLLVTSEDPDTRRQAAEALGYALPDEDVEEFEPPEYDDPIEQLTARQQAIEEQLRQRQAEEREQQEGEAIHDLAFGELADLDPNLSEATQNMIMAYAINALPPVKMPPGAPVRVLPDVKQAYEIWQAEQTESMKTWAKTKRAPVVMPGGVTANEVPDTSTHEGRVDRMMRRLSEMEQAD